MGTDTSIEWAHHSFNPWIGCTKVAAGCAHCYAEKNIAVTMGVGRGSWGPSGTRYVTAAANWRKPLAWAKAYREECGEGRGTIKHPHSSPDTCPDHFPGCPPRPPRPRVFCASLADVFEDRPELVEPRVRLASLILKTPELDWLLLTKRPENFGALWHDLDDTPFTNVWLGTSVACQEDADRNIPHLLRAPASVRFVSYEPAVGPIDFAFDHVCGCGQAPHPHTTQGGTGIDWLIVGGESGPKARPCDVAWLRSAVEQGKAAGVPVFVKQLGARPTCNTPGCDCATNGAGKNADPSVWAHDLQVRQVPRGR